MARLDRAVHPSALHEHRNRLGLPAAEEEELGLARLDGGQLLDVAHVQELIDVLDRGVGDLRRVQLLARHRHRREARPEHLALDVAAQPERWLPLLRRQCCH